MTHTAKGSARREQEKEEEVVLDFSTLKWQGARLDPIKEHLVNQIDLISKAPGDSSARIARLLSRRLEIDEDELLITDGGDGAVRLIADAHRGARSLILPPTGMEFRQALHHAGHEVTEAPEGTQLSDLVTDGIDFVWLSVPNNPDGKVYRHRDLLSLLKKHPDTTIIVDLSMRKYVLEETLKESDIQKYPNLVVLSSFSRAYNLAGLCVGYICARPDFINGLREDYVPTGISSLALEAVHYVLVHPASFTIPIRKWLRDARLLAKEIDKIEGFESKLSDAPFFLVECSSPAQQVAEYLLKEHHILVGTAAKGIDIHGNELRISPLPHQAENDALIEGLRGWAEADHATL